MLTSPEVARPQVGRAARNRALALLAARRCPTARRVLPSAQESELCFLGNLTAGLVPLAGGQLTCEHGAGAVQV
jgi:hypothetical protein